jgi:hypothetical protein
VSARAAGRIAIRGGIVVMDAAGTVTPDGAGYLAPGLAGPDARTSGAARPG